MGNATGDFALFGLEAYGEYAAGQTERSLHNLNADLAERQARDAIARSHVDIARVRREAADVTGSARAGYAGQNVIVSTGSALETQVATAELAQEDVNQIKINAAREAWGYRSEAIWEKFKGEEAAAAGKTGAIKSLISNAYAGGYIPSRDTSKDKKGDDLAGVK